MIPEFEEELRTMCDVIDLRPYSTQALVEELRSRAGVVKSRDVAPHQNCKFRINGPVTVLVVDLPLAPGYKTVNTDPDRCEVCKHFFVSGDGTLRCRYYPNSIIQRSGVCKCFDSVAVRGV